MTPGVLIQVRLKSQRLPLKAFRLIEGKPVLLRLIERLEPIRLCGIPLVICTSWEPQDDALQRFADYHKLPWYRGDPDNLAKRFLRAAEVYRLNPIVRVTGDNPLTDPELMLDLIAEYARGDYDYVFPVKQPRGVKSEVIRPCVLERMPADIDQEHKFSSWLALNTRAREVPYRGGLTQDVTCDSWTDLQRICAIGY